MNAITRQRLSQQGFGGLDDATLDQVGPWLRLAPGVCSAITLAGTFSANWRVLWALAPVAVIAAATGRHPIDRLYDSIVRPLLGRTQRIPRYGAPRRFSAGLAAVWLFVTGLAFLLGARVAASALGAFLGGALGLAALTDVCTGCIMYHRLLGRRVRRRIASRQPASVPSSGQPTGPRLSAARARQRHAYWLVLAGVTAVGGLAPGVSDLRAQPQAPPGVSRFTGTSFALVRYKAGSSTSAYVASRVGPAMVLGGFIHQPRGNRQTVILGVGTRLRLSRSSAVSVFAAGATTAGETTLRFYALPRTAAGNLLMTGTAAAYLPLGEAGRRQFQVDPLTISLPIGARLRAGLATTLAASERIRPDFGVGPSAQLRIPGGKITVELLARSSATGTQLRSSFNAAL